MEIKISILWETMKSKESLSYVDTNGNYYIYCTTEAPNIEYSCVLQKDKSEAEDFEDNFKDSATALI